MVTREHIIDEIKRVAAENGGKSPGRKLFENTTGIREGEWFGVFWPRWSDALAAAGLKPNKKSAKLSTQLVLEEFARIVKHLGKIPTNPEIRMYAREHELQIGHEAFSKHFGSKGGLLKAFAEWVRSRPEMSDLAVLLPEVSPDKMSDDKPPFISEGLVYLLKSGEHYKVGRSDQLEKRVKQISVSLPEEVSLVHSIRTDDPPGIEAYWHRRFAEQRANGEWFKLSISDVRAFKRRKFQ